MVEYRSQHTSLYRYDRPIFSALVAAGSIRVSTLEACRAAENPNAVDSREGFKTTTSLPGVDHPDSASFAKLLGVNPSGISIVGNAVKLVSTEAVKRTETFEAYVFCTSALESARMRANFGGGCVRIREPARFFNMVDEALRTLVPGPLGPCVVDDVEYGPRENNYRDHTDKHAAFLKPGGPPKHYEQEREVRAIWLPQGFRPAPIFIEIPTAASLLEELGSA